MNDAAWFIGIPLVVCALLVAGVGFGVRTVKHHYDTVECGTFSTQTGRTTKFVDYHYWSWDCLTPSNDGKWISIKVLREVPS